MKNWILELVREEEKNNVSPDYEALFYSIAKKLMNNYILQVNEKKFILTEIEFYYQDAACHNDTNTHGSIHQKKFGLHFHDKGYGGMDITFGDKQSYGGILVRGIKEFDQNNKYTDGPWNTVVKLLCEMYKIQKTDQDRINEWYRKLQSKNLCLKNVNLVETDTRNNVVFIGPRYGLVKDDDKYVIKNYRFITDFTPEHKFQEKGLVYLASNANEFLKDDIGNVPNFNRDTIMKSIAKNKNRSSLLYDRYNN